MIRSWKQPVNGGGSKSTNIPSCFVRIHWRELHLGYNEVGHGVMEKCLFQYLFSLCHLVSYYWWCCYPVETLKCQMMDVHFTLKWIDFAKRGQNLHLRTSSCWLWLDMSCQSLWQSTSQCLNVLQSSAETVSDEADTFSVIPAMDDNAAQSLCPAYSFTF